jgi:hypothetical protein
MIEPEKRERIVKEFERIINSNSLECGSDTPDFMLAEHLVRCLEVYDDTVRDREKWYGRKSKLEMLSEPLPR